MNNVYRIVPPEHRPFAEFLREVRGQDYRLTVISGKLVMIPLAAANQEIPRAA